MIHDDRLCHIISQTILMCNVICTLHMYFSFSRTLRTKNSTWPTWHPWLSVMTCLGQLCLCPTCVQPSETKHHVTMFFSSMFIHFPLLSALSDRPLLPYETPHGQDYLCLCFFFGMENTQKRTLWGVEQICRGFWVLLLRSLGKSIRSALRRWSNT